MTGIELILLFGGFFAALAILTWGRERYWYYLAGGTLVLLMIIDKRNTGSPVWMLLLGILIAWVLTCDKDRLVRIWRVLNERATTYVTLAGILFLAGAGAADAQCSRHIVVITQPGCYYCSVVLSFLERNRVAYTERSIAYDWEARRLSGGFTPVTYVGDRKIFGSNLAAIRDACG